MLTLGIIVSILKYPDVLYIALLSLLSTSFSLFVQCNKQTNKQTNQQTHTPFTTLSITILFTLLMSDTFYGLGSSSIFVNGGVNRNIIGNVVFAYVVLVVVMVVVEVIIILVHLLWSEKYKSSKNI